MRTWWCERSFHRTCRLPESCGCRCHAGGAGLSKAEREELERLREGVAEIEALLDGDEDVDWEVELDGIIGWIQDGSD